MRTTCRKKKKTISEEDPGRIGKSAVLRVLRQGFSLKRLKQKRQRKENYDEGSGGEGISDGRLSTSVVVDTSARERCEYCGGNERQDCMLTCDNRACKCSYHAFCIPGALRDFIEKGVMMH